MSSYDENGKKEDEGGWGCFFVAGFFILFAIIGIIATFSFFMRDDAPASDGSTVGQATERYNHAVELCGAENIERIDFQNGATDFECDDYSEVK